MRWELKACINLVECKTFKFLGFIFTDTGEKVDEVNKVNGIKVQHVLLLEYKIYLWENTE